MNDTPGGSAQQDRHRRIRRVFEAALAVPPERLQSLLDQQCGGDEELRRDVTTLLAARGRGEGFLAPPDGAAQETTVTIEDELAPGSLLASRYRIERVLGKGGFGVVYLARDTHLLDKAVVVKVLQQRIDSRDWVLKKFHQECEALARIDHPGVIGVLDQGDTPHGEHFLVMEFVNGATLRSVITPRGMCLNRIAAIVRQLGDALGAAHANGVFHRDLKPENILLKDMGGGREMAVIIDFGIAVVKESRFEADAATCVAGSFPYAAPEQLAGRAAASSDMYALAVIIYEMLTGVRPFRHSTPVDVYLQQKEEKWQPVSELRPEVPAAAERILAKALSFEPEERWGSVPEFTDELACALTCKTRTDPPPARPRRRAMIASSTLCAVLAGAAALWWRPWVAETPPSAAAEERSLRYWVLVRKPQAGTLAGEPFRLAGEMLFPQGYQIRLMFSSAEAGYFYLLNEAPPAASALPAYNVLFPSAARKDRSALLSAGEDIPIPSADSYFVFDEQEGEEKLWMIWSRDPVPELEAVKKWANPQDRGRVGGRNESLAVKEYLERSAQARARKDVDETARVTTLRAPGGLMVHLLRLEHH
jgi:serine/threonine-protein kinase